MKRDELKGKQTRTEWTCQKDVKWVWAHDMQMIVADIRGFGFLSSKYGEEAAAIEQDANAALICEAGTVANETGLWPLDMMERIKKLEEALETLTGQAERAGWNGMSVHAARAILNEKMF